MDMGYAPIGLPSDSKRTWIESEDHAYNTYGGAHSRSNRRGRAVYPDGRVRAVVLGVADTFFSIPAHGRVRGKYVAGFVSVQGNGTRGSGEYVFTVYSKFISRVTGKLENSGMPAELT